MSPLWYGSWKDIPSSGVFGYNLVCSWAPVKPYFIFYWTESHSRLKRPKLLWLPDVCCASLAGLEFFCIYSWGGSQAADDAERYVCGKYEEKCSETNLLEVLEQWFSNFLRSRTTWCFFNVGVYTPGFRRT